MQKYYCKNCGAELYWDADSQSLKCEYCDNEYLPSDFEDASLSKNPVKSEEANKQYTSAGQDLSDDMVVYKCNNCSGEVIADKKTVATVCPYCGRALSITSKIVGEFRPDLVLPFKVGKDKAVSAYEEYVSKSHLTPKEFRSNRVISKIQGMYVPYYLVTDTAQGDIVYNCEKVWSRRSGYDKVVTHKVYDVYISGVARFRQVPGDASEKLNDTFMDTIEPFDYSTISSFNPGYMAGFIADIADVDKKSVVDRILEKIKKGLLPLLSEEVGYWNTKSLKSYTCNHKDIKSEYAMLPIWIVSEEYQGTIYTFGVNGVTGKVVGKLPLSKSLLAGKAGIAFAIGFVATALVTGISSIL